MGIAVLFVVITGVVLIGVLRADLKKEQRGEESEFWEADK